MSLIALCENPHKNAHVPLVFNYVLDNLETNLLTLCAFKMYLNRITLLQFLA